MKTLTSPVCWAVRARRSSVAVALSSLVAMMAACSEGKQEALEPQMPAVTVDDSAVPTVPVASNLIAGLTLSPVSANVRPGESVSFQALGWNAGANTPIAASVTWSATGGTINSSGVFTAGATAGTYQVKATSTTTWHTETAVVVVAGTPVAPAAAVSQLLLAPVTVSLTPGATQQFGVSAKLTDGSSVASTSATWTATGGTINANGLYTAGSTPGTYSVIARSSNGKADTSTVTLTATAQAILGLTIAPATASLAPGASVTFQPQGWVANANTPVAAPVTWSATGGTITPAGVYTAGPVGGTFQVKAVSTTSNKTETATVTISGSAPGTPVIAGIVMTPATVTVSTNSTQQFSVSATMTTGGAQSNPSVTWSATGGTISSSGLYKAGSTAGNYSVIARSANGKADTSAVKVTAPTAATITGVTTSPASVSLSTGSAQQFSVSASMSDGSTQSNPTVTWSATGGSISAGKYTAGSAAGTYRVIATANGKADTSTVTVTSPSAPPPVTGNGEPTPGGTIFFDGRAGGKQSFQSVNSLSEVNNFIKANGGVGLESNWAFTTDYNGSGKHALRIDWRANPTGESGATGTFYYPGSYSRVYTSVVIHLGRTATGGGNGSVGSFKPVSNAGGMKRFMWLRNKDNGTDRLYWVWPAGGQPGGQKLSIDNRDYDSSWNTTYPVGVDVRYTFEIIAGNPGSLKVWQNGVLVHSNTNAAIGSLPFSESQLSTVRFATQQDESEYWTDLVMWTK